jgi:hypothetical protein
VAPPASRVLPKASSGPPVAPVASVIPTSADLTAPHLDSLKQFQLGEVIRLAEEQGASTDAPMVLVASTSGRAPPAVQDADANVQGAHTGTPMVPVATMSGGASSEMTGRDESQVRKKTRKGEGARGSRDAPTVPITGVILVPLRSFNRSVAQ